MKIVRQDDQWVFVTVTCFACAGMGRRRVRDYLSEFAEQDTELCQNCDGEGVIIQRFTVQEWEAMDDGEG